MVKSSKRPKRPCAGQAAARPGPADLLTKRMLEQLTERSHISAGDLGLPTAGQYSTRGAGCCRDPRLPASGPQLLRFRSRPGAARCDLIRSIQQRPRTLRDIWCGWREFSGPRPLQDLIRPGRGRPAAVNRRRGLRRGSSREKGAKTGRRDRGERSHRNMVRPKCRVTFGFSSAGVELR
jgi:hypothetical protein